MQRSKRSEECLNCRTLYSSENWKTQIAAAFEFKYPLQPRGRPRKAAWVNECANVKQGSSPFLLPLRSFYALSVSVRGFSYSND